MSTFSTEALLANAAEVEAAYEQLQKAKGRPAPASQQPSDAEPMAKAADHANEHPWANGIRGAAVTARVGRGMHEATAMAKANGDAATLERLRTRLAHHAEQAGVPVPELSDAELRKALARTGGRRTMFGSV